MPTLLVRSLDRARRVISGFTLAQRTIAVIGLALLVMGAVALGSWLARPQMSPLFTGLSASDASAVVEQLKSAGVGYELTDGGATILVPDDKVYPQRLAAAAAGLPSDTSKGYTLLDKMGVTASEFQQSVTYKRAIEGELANTIGAMNGITTATVQLAIPKDSVFVSEKQNPTASVFVKTKNGATLGDNQVQAIVHLTSAAIPGMRPQDVAVTDQNGTVLWAVGAGLVGGSSKQATEYETKVASAVGRMLETIVGAGNATVTVAADVANSTSERMDETYTAPTPAPTGGPLSSSEKTKTESYTGAKGTGTGVLGPDNIAVPSGADGNGAYKSEESTKDNAINKSTQKTVTPAGEVTRQTVSIALNQGVVKGVTAQQVQALVATAAGIDTRRGDTVTVEFVPFSTAAAAGATAALTQAENEKAAQRQADLLRTAIIGGAIVLAAIILVVFLVIRARRRRLALDDSGPIGLLDAMTESEEQKLRALRSLGSPMALPAPVHPLELPTAVLELDEEPEASQIVVERRRREIDDIVKTDPEAAATALASLMDEAHA
ncbi:flagellar basal-body MS-ring/collar protein FliF [Microbacterium capsulatum]|uniref:Flagellar M-ring protein n=1 Tax=Microbacterium capsulatum TaxID=3041921 RepID=A0ABU0XDJ6_9MICO|nr:flagellar basal-body MS-ring/collar protein FliF [Microbacterium sp. ASV81]MDQ4213196.1 flagellar basal-body MS-ring/collar protein FliF [Microbacterium sp. ASV81]